MSTSDPAESFSAGRVSGARLFANSSQNFAAAGLQIAGRALGGLLIPFLLPPEKYGRYAYFLWLTTILIQMSTLGIPHAAQRYISQTKDAAARAGTARFLRGIGLSTALLLFVIFVIVQFALFGSEDYDLTVLSLLLAGAGCGVYSVIQIAIYKGYQDFAYPAIVEAATQGLRIALLLLFFLHRSSATVVLVFSVEVIYWACEAAGLSFRRRRLEGSRGVGGFMAARGILSYSATVGLIVLIDILIWQRIEIVFLEKFGFISDVGFFNLAVQITTLMMAGPSVAATAFFPSFAQFQHEPVILKHVYCMVASFLWIVAVPILAVGFFLVPIVLAWVYGESYAPAAAVLPFILAGRSFLLVSGVMSTLLYAIGFHRQILKVALPGAVLSILVDFVLIRSFALMGAGLSLLLVNFLIFVMSVILMQRLMGYSVPIRARTGIAGVLILLVGAAIAWLGWPGLATLAVVLAYGAVCMQDPATRAVIDWIGGKISEVLRVYVLGQPSS